MQLRCLPAARSAVPHARVLKWTGFLQTAAILPVAPPRLPPAALPPPLPPPPAAPPAEARAKSATAGDLGNLAARDGNLVTGDCTIAAGDLDLPADSEWWGLPWLRGWLSISGTEISEEGAMQLAAAAGARARCNGRSGFGRSHLGERAGAGDDADGSAAPKPSYISAVISNLPRPRCPPPPDLPWPSMALDAERTPNLPWPSTSACPLTLHGPPCRYISPYLRWGLLSARQAEAAGVRRRDLLWRDFSRLCWRLVGPLRDGEPVTQAMPLDEDDVTAGQEVEAAEVAAETELVAAETESEAEVEAPPQASARRGAWSWVPPLHAPEIDDADETIALPRGAAAGPAPSWQLVAGRSGADGFEAWCDGDGLDGIRRSPLRFFWMIRLLVLPSGS